MAEAVLVTSHDRIVEYVKQWADQVKVQHKGCLFRTLKKWVPVNFSADLCRSCLLDLGSEGLKERGWLQSNAVDNLT